MAAQRPVFFISDRTGLTAETLGHSLLTQFESIRFQTNTIPFVKTRERAEQVLADLNRITEETGVRPVVFSTVVDDEVRTVLRGANVQFCDFFETFVGPLEKELGIASSHTVGKSYTGPGQKGYNARIDAVHFALANDDGAVVKNYDRADVIITGVSRIGKTPTCFALAMQYGVFAANYPLDEYDLDTTQLPKVLQPYRDKLFGLTINAEVLQKIRTERRPGSKYAQFEQCETEVRKTERMFRAERIPFINTTTTSIEEIATRIIHGKGLKRRFE